MQSSLFIWEQCQSALYLHFDQEKDHLLSNFQDMFFVYLLFYIMLRIEKPLKNSIIKCKITPSCKLLCFVRSINWSRHNNWNKS